MEDLSCETNNASESRVLSKYESRRMASKMANIKKKTNQLSILCDTPVFLIALYSDGKAETWPENQSQLMELMTRYKNTKRNKKKFKYGTNLPLDDDNKNTRDGRFKKLLSVPNKEIVMKVVQERIQLLKRRKSEINKINGTRRPINNDCQDETQTSVNMVESEEEEIDQRPPQPHQNSQNYIPITGTLYVPNNLFQVGDLQKNLSEGNYFKFPTIFMPKQQQQQQQPPTPPLYDHHYSHGSTLERDFITGLDTATSSTNN